ncbi:MAG: tetratricopeptide repeat-containing sulfotransferase family protein [Rhodospirillales bacterium]
MKKPKAKSAAHSRAGLDAHMRGDAAEARAFYERALAKDKRDALALRGLGLLAHQQGRYENALPYLRRAVKAAPDNAEFSGNLGNCLRAAGQVSEAVEVLRRAVRLAPRESEAAARSNLGLALRTAGDIAAAGREFRAAIGLNPELAEAYEGLAKTGWRAGAEAGAEIDFLADLMASGRLTGRRRAIAGYALGKLLDDRGDHQRAFEAFKAANSVKQAAFSPAAFDALTARIIKTFDAAWFAKAGAEAGGGGDGAASGTRIQPAFIAGLPRTGTSLLEQIIASHPAVQSAGETNAVQAWAHGQTGGQTGGQAGVGEPTEDWPAHAAKADLSGLCADVRAALARALESGGVGGVGVVGGGEGAAQACGVVTEKSIRNTEYLGLILRAFPAAPVIVPTRDPRDVLLSIWCNDFSARAPFATEPEWIVCYLNAMRRLAAHWREMSAARLTEIAYEDLIENPEAAVRRVLAALGLEFDPACLAFHEREGAVLTASDWQVRQPLSRDRAGRWRGYKSALGPYLDRLEGLA